MKRLSNWVEIPVTDLPRAIRFYSQIFGIELQTMELGEVSYALFPSEDPYNCGALAKCEYYTPS